MVRALFGTVLLPTALLALWAAVQAIGGLTARPHATAAWPFLAGLGLYAAGWGFVRYAVEEHKGPVKMGAALSRRVYVFGHELTHALAAWSVGAKVLAFKVGEDGGHVDLSHSNAFVALAPYCFPVYTLLVVASYRVLLWMKPQAGGRALFLAAMGLTIAFHLLRTYDAVRDVEQPDLPAAGGVMFSLSWILFANGVVVLLLVKALFPAAVDLRARGVAVVVGTRGFWLWVWNLVEPLKRTFIAQLNHP